MEKMVSAAVITADIVNFTGLSKAEQKKLLQSLSVLLQPHKHEFYRGDSFQVYIRNPEEALSTLLQARVCAIRMPKDSSSPSSDIRASIGIGGVQSPVRVMATAGGEAFILSGRAFDELGEGKRRLTMACQHPIINLGLEAVAHFVDYLFQRLTSKQASVVFELLKGHTQVEVARRLRKSQATINKHAQAAGWTEIGPLLSGYRNLIHSLVESYEHFLNPVE